MNPDARFVLYGQRGSPWATRRIGRRESDDYFHWSDNRPVIESRVDDPPGLGFYGLSGAIVNRTYAGLHLGMLWAYDTDPAEPNHPARNEGVIDVLLAFSRDTIRWQRFPGPFIRRGQPGSFAAGLLLAQYPLVKNGRLYFFYTGFPATHAVESFPAIGLSMLRLDGFVSLEATGFRPGTATTRPHRWAGEGLFLNVDAEHGTVTVQLQDETGRPFEGFSHVECSPVQVDSLAHDVTWRGSGDATALRGKLVALQFRLGPAAKLYSYTLANPASGGA